jgi:spermidine synthase
VNFLERIRPGKTITAASTVQISESDGIRSLHLGSETVQSSMRISAPNELVLHYTRAMMCFLLFGACPARIAMLGLGGGSLAKFVYHHLPACRTVVVENSAPVIVAARQYFHVPKDDARFRVIEADGAVWVQENPRSSDVLMVDGYDGRRKVEEFCTPDFYRAAAKAVSPRGMLVVNLWSNDSRFDSLVQNIEAAFDGQVVLTPALRHGNIIAIAFAGGRAPEEWSELKHRATELEALYGLEFPRFLGGMKRLNPHTERWLLI